MCKMGKHLFFKKSSNDSKLETALTLLYSENIQNGKPSSGPDVDKTQYWKLKIVLPSYSYDIFGAFLSEFIEKKIYLSVNNKESFTYLSNILPHSLILSIHVPTEQTKLKFSATAWYFRQKKYEFRLEWKVQLKLIWGKSKKKQ